MRFLLSLLIVLPMFAQQPPPADGQRPAGQRPGPKNLKLLQPSEIRPMMGAFRTALGVQCTHCHVQGDFASDDNAKKEVARNMIVMMREINGKFPDGKIHVTCYTCHRGAIDPATAPTAAAAPAASAGARPEGTPPPPPPPPPAQ